MNHSTASALAPIEQYEPSLAARADLMVAELDLFGFLTETNAGFTDGLAGRSLREILNPVSNKTFEDLWPVIQRGQIWTGALAFAEPGPVGERDVKIFPELHPQADLPLKFFLVAASKAKITTEKPSGAPEKTENKPSDTPLDAESTAELDKLRAENQRLKQALAQQESVNEGLTYEMMMIGDRANEAEAALEEERRRFAQQLAAAQNPNEKIAAEIGRLERALEEQQSQIALGLQEQGAAYEAQIAQLKADFENEFSQIENENNALRETKQQEFDQAIEKLKAAFQEQLQNKETDAEERLKLETDLLQKEIVRLQQKVWDMESVPAPRPSTEGQLSAEKFMAFVDYFTAKFTLPETRQEFSTLLKNFVEQEELAGQGDDELTRILKKAYIVLQIKGFAPAPKPAEPEAPADKPLWTYADVAQLLGADGLEQFELNVTIGNWDDLLKNLRQTAETEPALLPFIAEVEQWVETLNYSALEQAAAAMKV